MKFNMLNTIKGSLMENFYPSGWDLQKIRACLGTSPEEAMLRQPFWHPDFQVDSCEDRPEFYVKLGFEIASQIKRAREEKTKLALVLPVGPMEQYNWVVYFLKYWNVCCDHLYCFSMDEWTDDQGNSTPGDEIGSFQFAMERGFFGKLGQLTVPRDQRFFATRELLPFYRDKIDAIKADGGKLITVYGVGRDFHVAFWEPHFGDDYDSDEEWRQATHRIAAQLHPLSIEQNAILSYKSDFTSVPCRANTIGPGIFLESDYCIGGVDAIFDYGAATAGVSLWCTLRHGPSRWIPSSYMPTLPGKFFFVEQLAEKIVVSEH
ncbi:MAG TPA: glucosamine-6-phosphate isomerase [Bacillota bacterium]|jgi:glucosamine-6-phosphate deaminase|nr:glucosamine-6-phosphate isomerase [Fastidiosipila sp.]HPX92610.1 glucosamine-6-phosphate isomerase [Bacillota bacterium]HQB81122.1 glucosamine-6-phosphate isomerase [Bacillota bacterium]